MDARRDAKTGVLVITHHEVTDREARSICADGHPVDVLNSFAFGEDGNEARHKSGVPSQPSLPSEFAIYRPWWWHAGFAGPVYGNFWVPNVRPANHQWHVVDFTISPWNFQNAGPNAHMVTGVYFNTFSNMTQDFHAKGMFLSARDMVTNFCPANKRAVIETWGIDAPLGSNGQPDCNAPGAYCDVVVHGSQFGNSSTCGSWDSVSPQRVLVGANSAQDTAYILCTPGGACPTSFAKPTSTMGFNPSLQRGVMFLVAGDDGVAPWTPQFSNVISYGGM